MRMSGEDLSCCMMVSLIVGPVVGYLPAVKDCSDGMVSNSSTSLFSIDVSDIL